MGSEQPAPAAPVGSGNRGCVIAAAVISGGFLLICALVIGISALSGNDSGPRASDSLVACHTAIRGDFKNPATVDFHTTVESLTETSAGWKLTGELDVKTPLGVEQTFSYTCTTAGSTVVSHQSVRTG